MRHWVVAFISLLGILWLKGRKCLAEPVDNLQTRSIPVQLSRPGLDAPITKFLEFNLYDDDINSVSALFCKENYVTASFCTVLVDHLSEFVANERATHALPQPNLPRHESAATAQRKRVFAPHLFSSFQDIINSEDAVVSLLKTKWSGHAIQRLGFLHSCQVTDSSDTRILERMLNQVSESGLLNSMDTLVVLNYGPAISQAVKDRFSFKIEWIQVHPDILYFETPSIRILQHMIKHLRAAWPSVDPQVLYLHTKGVSYLEYPPHVRDWTDLMLHFLVEKHDACLHLLQSGEIDAVGVLFRPHVEEHFSGNFWWAAGSYVAAREELLHEQTAKYAAETWLLRRSNARIFVLHNTILNHYEVSYPRACYVGVVAGNGSLCGGPDAVGARFRRYIELPL